MCTSPQDSRYNLSDLLKILYFPATLTVFIMFEKDEKFNTFISNIVKKTTVLASGKAKRKNNATHAAHQLSPQLRIVLNLAPHIYYRLLHAIVQAKP